MITFQYHDHELTASDFPRDEFGRTAFEMGMNWNTRCSNKEAAVELMVQSSRSIHNRVLKPWITLIEELDIEMDGVSCPGSAAAILNALRSKLREHENGMEEHEPNESA